MKNVTVIKIFRKKPDVKKNTSNAALKIFSLAMNSFFLLFDASYIINRFSDVSKNHGSKTLK